MASDKGFRNMKELVAALSAAGEGLASGALGREGLEAACEDARELYERLVVLRHKAREATRSGTTPLDLTAEPGGEGTIRLDTRPTVVSPRQTSLIEAIEANETPTTPSVENDPVPEHTRPARKSKAKGPATLAEKLEKAAIGDLTKAITLQHKFWFVAELFNGDRVGFESTISVLNGLSDRESAVNYVQEHVVARLSKPPDPEAVTTFLELIERRYQ